MVRETGGPPQLSVAVAVSKQFTPGHSAHVFSAAGGTVSVGGVSSTTFTVCAPVAVLPQASVAVQVRVQVPTGEPSEHPSRRSKTSSSEVGSTSPSQASVAVAVPKQHPPGQSSHLVSAPAGAESAGTLVSTTAVVCDLVVLPPQVLAAVHAVEHNMQIAQDEKETSKATMTTTNTNGNIKRHGQLHSDRTHCESGCI